MPFVEELRQLADNLSIALDVSPAILWLMLFMAAFFVVNLILFGLRSLSVLRALNLARSQVAKRPAPLTTSALQELTKEFEKSHFLRHNWTEFRETLDVPADPAGAVTNTRQADAFINVNSACAQLHLQWYSTVPGLLTGMGLIGTFIAIYLALGTLTADEYQIANLSQFITELKGKFISSIVGLIGACSFLVMEKLLLSAISGLCADLQTLLNERLTQAPFELSLNRLSVSTSAATARLDQLQNDLPGWIDAGLRNAVSQPVAEIVQHVDQLHTLMEQQAQRREESITKLVTKVVSDFKQALFDTTDKHFETLSDVLSRSIAVVDGFNTRMNETIAQTERLLKAQKDQVDDLARWQKQQTEEIIKMQQDEQKLLLSHLKKQAGDLLDSQSAEMKSLLKAVDSTCSDMIRSQERMSEQLVAKLGESLEKFSLQVEKRSTRQAESVQQTHDYILNSLTSWIEGLNEDLYKHLKQLSDASLRTQEAIDEISRAVKMLQAIPESNSQSLADLSARFSDIGRLADNLQTATAGVSARQYETARILDRIVRSQMQAAGEVAGPAGNKSGNGSQDNSGHKLGGNEAGMQDAGRTDDTAHGGAGASTASEDAAGNGGSGTAARGEGKNAEPGKAAERDGKNAEPGKAAERDGKNAEPGAAAEREGKNADPGAAAERDGKNAEPGKAAERDGKNAEPGKAAERDGRNAEPGAAAEREGKNAEPGAAAEREGKNAEPGAAAEREGRNADPGAAAERDSEEAKLDAAAMAGD